MFPPPRPWKELQPVDPDREYVAFTSRFFLRSPLRVLAFMRYSSRIMKQVETAPGAVGWSLAANLPTLEFYTLSAWDSADDLRAFLKAGAHGESVGVFANDMRRKSIFVQYKVRGRELPLQWKDAVEQQVARAV
jgi:heme-degrading monooxygenase HmoA